MTIGRADRVLLKMSCKKGSIGMLPTSIKTGTNGSNFRECGKVKNVLNCRFRGVQRGGLDKGWARKVDVSSLRLQSLSTAEAAVRERFIYLEWPHSRF